MADCVAGRRFFDIAELVSLMLHGADTVTLVHCQRVCRTWSDIIRQCPVLQETLFLRPKVDFHLDLNETTTTDEPPILNPVLQKFFSPLLTLSDLGVPGVSFALQTQIHTSADLDQLPWARDGTNLTAAARTVFTRPEASWRKMFVTQPPLLHLDWWHSWSSDACMCSVSAQEDPSHPEMSGTGYGNAHDTPLTLGALWDFVEARLARGCGLQMTVFLAGCPYEEDPTADETERAFARMPGNDGRRRALIAYQPRVSVVTTQRWGVGPSMHQYFDFQGQGWVVDDRSFWLDVMDEERWEWRDWEGNGFIWLNEDCKREEEERCQRWSRSDGCQRSLVTLRGKGGGRQAHLNQVRHRVTMARIRARMRSLE